MSAIRKTAPSLSNYFLNSEFLGFAQIITTPCCSSSLRLHKTDQYRLASLIFHLSMRLRSHCVYCFENPAPRPGSNAYHAKHGTALLNLLGQTFSQIPKIVPGGCSSDRSLRAAIPSKLSRQLETTCDPHNAIGSALQPPALECQRALFARTTGSANAKGGVFSFDGNPLR